MTEDDLTIFLHLAGSGSLSASARSLRQPKSSVSRALARIETDAGVALFERSTRHFRLTDAGVLLRPYAERVVHDLQEARLQLEGLAGEARGLVRVNTTPSFAQGLIAPMLPALIERHPQLRVELETDPRTIDMVQEGVDLVVRIGPLADSSLIARKLPSIDLLMVASPAYLERRGTPADLSELVDHDLVTRDANARWTFHREGTERTIEPRGRLIVADAAAQKVVVEGGAGIACLPSYSAATSIQAGTLVRLMPDWQRPSVEIHAVYPTHQGLSAKVRVFIDALTAHLAR
jgi:DNA-binding transcriptional LysR family regulator